MNTISVFNHVTVDGYFAGPHGEIDWFKSIAQDDDYGAFTHGQAQGRSTLVLGRTTYTMMKSFWPTEQARAMDPHMADVMDNSPKIVFSRTMQDVAEEPHWKNVTLRHAIDRDEILGIKAKSSITILGSGSIVQQFANLGLIDDYHLMVVPLVLGTGKPLFQNVKTDMTMESARGFRNGIVALHYKPAL